MFKSFSEWISIWARLPYARMLAILLAVVCLLLRNEVIRLNEKLDIKDDTITILRINQTVAVEAYYNTILQRQQEEYKLLLERLKVKEERERKLVSMLLVNYRYLNTKRIK